MFQGSSFPIIISFGRKIVNIEDMKVSSPSNEKPDTIFRSGIL